MFRSVIVLWVLGLSWVWVFATMGSAQVYKPNPYDPVLEARILAHRCVSKVTFASTICGPAETACKGDAIRVLMILTPTADLDRCRVELQSDLPDLRFVRQYPQLKWLVAIKW
jgi:hypothetical protein